MRLHVHSVDEDGVRAEARPVDKISHPGGRHACRTTGTSQVINLLHWPGIKKWLVVLPVWPIQTTPFIPYLYILYQVYYDRRICLWGFSATDVLKSGPSKRPHPFRMGRKRAFCLEIKSLRHLRSHWSLLRQRRSLPTGQIFTTGCIKEAIQGYPVAHSKLP